MFLQKFVAKVVFFLTKKLVNIISIFAAAYNDKENEDCNCSSFY